MPQDWAEELRDQFQDAANAIYASIRDGRLSRLQALLNASPPLPNLNHIHQKYGTPLHFAAWCGDLDAVELLLAAGADPLASSRVPVVGIPINSAAKNGHTHIVKLLWSPAVQEIEHRKMETGRTSLLWAAEGGHTRIVEHLLMWDGWSGQQKAAALISAATHWHLDAVAALLKTNTFQAWTVRHALECTVDENERAWGEPNGRTAEGWDYYNLEQLVELLINTLRTAPNKRDNEYSFVLLTAAFNANFTGVLKVLLDKGADVNRQNSAGHTALHTLASPRPVGNSGREIMNKTAIKFLLQHGASVAKPDKKGVSPIQVAAQASDLDSFRIFLSSSTRQGEDEQALLSLSNAKKETLLHYAAAGYQIDIIEYLISQGLDINARNFNGWTPLICALMPRSDIVHSQTTTTNTAAAIQTALLLLNHGADPTIATHEGWTPLHALALHCDLDIRGKIESLATQFIAWGVNPEARTSLIISAGKSSYGDDIGTPWDHRVPNALSVSSKRPIVVQPNLTPLLWAAQCGAVGVVKALLTAQVDITITDANGMSAAAIAWEIKAVPILAEAADAIISLLF